MNRHERDALLQFLAPLLRTRAADKDATAETLILEQCARQPDALYLLVQRAMVLQSALDAAQARIAELQAAVAAAGTDDRGAALASEDARQRSGAWGRGLLTQATAISAGVGLGVTAGVVAGGLLLDAAEDWLGGDA